MPNMTRYGHELPVALLDILPDPVFVKDDQLRYVWVNASFEALVGMSKSDIVGKRDADLFVKDHAPQRETDDHNVLRNGCVDEAYQTMAGPGGQNRELVTRKSRLILEDGTTLLAGVIHDVTYISQANKELEMATDLLAERADELKRIAETDVLTGCLNRRALFERGVAIGSGRNIGVLLMDLDHFKAVNDTYGHTGGDIALQAFVACARRHLRQNDLFARLGGEEFTVILPDLLSDAVYSIAHRIRTAWAETEIDIAGTKVNLTVSIGAAIWPAQATLDLDAALAAADRNLYAAKEAGRNRVVMQDAA